MSPMQTHHHNRSSTGSASRVSSTGAAIRRGEMKISEPIPIPREGVDGLGPQTGVGSPEYQAATALRNTQITLDRSSGVRNEVSQHPLHSSPSVRNKFSVNGSQDFGSPSQQVNISASNPHDSMSSTQSKQSTRKKRKDSTLKSVMKKIFGSKRGEGNRKSSSPERRSVQSPEVWRDPGNLITTPVISRQPRSGSVQNEVTRMSALGSHSPFAPGFDFKIDQQPRESIASPEYRSHRRRATLPSIIFSREEAREIAVSLGRAGLDVGKKQIPTEERVDTAELSGPLHLKRRSRSAQGLHDAMREHQMSPIQWRRRSAEIQYWRNSVIEQPIPTRPRSRPQTAGKEAQLGSAEECHTTPVKREDPDIPEIQETPFDFGPLVESMQSTDSATLEQRMATLEVKSMDLEYAISKLQGSDPSRRPLVPGDSPQRPFPNQAAPSRQTIRSHQPTEPHLEVHSGRMGMQPTTFLASTTRSVVVDDGQKRPISDTNTVRPMTAQRAISPSTDTTSDTDRDSPAPVTVEHFNSLITLIRLEEASRKKLQLQVMQLQRQVRELQAAVGWNPWERSHFSPLSETHDRGISSRSTHAPSDSQTSRWTGTEAGDSDTDDGLMDVYETPTENQEPKFDIEYLTRHQAGMI